MRYMILVLLLLAGCVDKQTHNQDQISLGQVPATRQLASAPTIEYPGMPVALERGLADLRQESVASNNVTKNDIQGIGVQVAKMAEKIQGFGGDLAHLQATVSLEQKIDAKLEAVTNIDAKLQAVVSASVQSAITTEINSRLDVVANTMAKAEANIGSTVSSLDQKVAAGRDSTVTNFPQQAVDILKEDSRNERYIMLGVLSLMVTITSLYTKLILKLTHESRQRAEERCEQYRKHVLGGKKDDVTGSQG